MCLTVNSRCTPAAINSSIAKPEKEGKSDISSSDTPSLWDKGDNGMADEDDVFRSGEGDRARKRRSGVSSNEFSEENDLQKNSKNIQVCSYLVS